MIRLLLACLFTAGCMESASNSSDASIHVRWISGGWTGVEEWHDDHHGVTCWRTLSGSGVALSCLPDSALRPPDGGQR